MFIIPKFPQLVIEQNKIIHNASTNHNAQSWHNTRSAANHNSQNCVTSLDQWYLLTVGLILLYVICTVSLWREVSRSGRWTKQKINETKWHQRTKEMNETLKAWINTAKIHLNTVENVSTIVFVYQHLTKYILWNLHSNVW